MADDVERLVLEAVWPIECESIGDEALASILTADQHQLKEVDLKGGDNLQIHDIYKLLIATLDVVKQLKTQFKAFVSAGGKPDKFVVTDGTRKMVFEVASPEIRAVLAEQMPKIIEAFLAANKKRQR